MTLFNIFFSHKQNKRDVRRAQKSRDAPGRHQNRRPPPKSSRTGPNPRQPSDQNVHQMLYGQAPPRRRPKKKQSSDCTVM